MVPAVRALTSIESFYPPDLNSTGWINNTALGAYGAIYNAPTAQVESGSPYGVYDYCAMPHPRVTEYSAPEEQGAKLVYLEYLQRHQRRTPYNIPPNAEVGDTVGYSRRQEEHSQPTN